MIHKSVLLACPPPRAFALFTTRISDWWPPSRRHTKDPQSHIELLASGRFYERSREGHEVELGRVVSFEPPVRIVLDFYVGTDPGHPTIVEITFAGEPDGTRITVDHRPTEKSREMWNARAPRFEESWQLVVEALSHARLDDW